MKQEKTLPEVHDELPFTGGKWEVYERFPGAFSVGVNPDEPEKMIPIASLFQNKKSKVDALVIAAAPAMYEALKGLVEWWESHQIAAHSATEQFEKSQSILSSISNK